MNDVLQEKLADISSVAKMIGELAETVDDESLKKLLYSYAGQLHMSIGSIHLYFAGVNMVIE